ncbi:hypothetical protein F5Y15DRAFT_398949 [Xylariaceae sp. FL0016]|nr:hypothetical protein F5Y15DRAFT_398949 [Xylariaceae sp. FL0016]
MSDHMTPLLYFVSIFFKAEGRYLIIVLIAAPAHALITAVPCLVAAEDCGRADAKRLCRESDLFPLSLRRGDDHDEPTYTRLCGLRDHYGHLFSVYLHPGTWQRAPENLKIPQGQRTRSEMEASDWESHLLVIGSGALTTGPGRCGSANCGPSTTSVDAIFNT